jgi:hypothetical protein
MAITNRYERCEFIINDSSESRSDLLPHWQWVFLVRQERPDHECMSLQAYGQLTSKLLARSIVKLDGHYWFTWQFFTLFTTDNQTFTPFLTMSHFRS